ncbi:hypothetical protein B0H10DRAFT_2047093 [Mycena sp. CBHHK59/15]|nr:hypothetical protein B0H10DRAFT_2047093 [Mycena sp. CBHHK59/15]
MSCLTVRRMIRAGQQAESERSQSVQEALWVASSLYGRCHYHSIIGRGGDTATRRRGSVVAHPLRRARRGCPARGTSRPRPESEELDAALDLAPSVLAEVSLKEWQARGKLESAKEEVVQERERERKRQREGEKDAARGEVKENERVPVEAEDGLSRILDGIRRSAVSDQPPTCTSMSTMAVGLPPRFAAHERTSPLTGSSGP